MGALQIRQVRVTNQSCQINSYVPAGRYSTCFGEYSEENEDTRPWQGGVTGNTYQYTTGHSLLYGLSGWGPDCT